MITRLSCFNEMLDLTQKIVEAKKEMLIKKQDILQKIKANKIKKLACEIDVANCVDASGKSVYSNADKRLVLVNIRLDKDLLYVENTKTIDLYSSIVDSLLILLTMYVYKFRTYLAYANFVL